jgi:beta-galactosidase
VDAGWSLRPGVAGEVLSRAMSVRLRCALRAVPLFCVACLLPASAQAAAAGAGIAVSTAGVAASQAQLPPEVSLDGAWQSGIGRVYDKTVQVPGLAQNPANASPGMLWYRRTVELPAGTWTTATLTLHGARFAPQVYVDGALVGSAPGGMAPITLQLNSSAVAPGKRIELEIALQSLTTLSNEDASSVPGADRWRTNISSGLWDGVTLHFSADARIAHVVPFTDFAHRTLAVHWQTSGAIPAQAMVTASLEDEAGHTLAASTAQPAGDSGISNLTLPASITAWSPDTPALYRLRVSLATAAAPLDTVATTWGLREFAARDKHFYLNGEPITLRGGTVVWQRFLRNPEAPQTAFDPQWFQRNIFLRLKSYGANTMRFHLALPPEALLDLCDRDGLMVQMEWPFFHGIPASIPSMTAQWRDWLDVAMRHPSVMIVHGWNETDGRQLEHAWTAMNAALTGYPPLVVAHRDTLHIHKYWWSLFENLGLYYDSYQQFDRTIMVDEFGGDYLDRNGDPGLYPTVKETFLRFLGRHQTREERLGFQAEANARVGEYWRRIGAAGVLPFCILGSPQDGSVWFLGSLEHPQPMPVWDALAATFAPLSVSLDLWDRNFTPGQRVQVPVYFFNDTPAAAHLIARVDIRSSAQPGAPAYTRTLGTQLAAHSLGSTPVELVMPSTPGDWTVSVTLLNAVKGVTHPIISSWGVHVLQPSLPPSLAHVIVGIAPDDAELRAFAAQNGLRSTTLDDPAAQLLLTSGATWQHLTPKLLGTLRAAIDRGHSVVMLDAGPRDLGQAGSPGTLGPLDGAPVLKPSESYHLTQPLFDGVTVSFTQLPEPESHMHPGPAGDALWNGLPRDSAWLWNGLRGGLVAPAANMEVTGLDADAFLTLWAGRGADAAAMRSGQNHAYELAGYYAFSAHGDDEATIAALRKRVQFLAADAPSLDAVLDPNSPVQQTDLGAGFRAANLSQAKALEVLAVCGKGLTRDAMVELGFGAGRGRLVLSQALTAGRLRRDAAAPGFYGIRYDPAAEQLTLNLMAHSLQ